MKVRPALLVAEQEPEGALSTRKLVLETAKFNVVTAHSAEEARAVLDLMAPGLAALVLTANLDREDDCVALAKVYKEKKPDSPVIFLSPDGYQDCRWSDYQLSSHEPEKLVTLIRSLFGDPRRIA